LIGQTISHYRIVEKLGAGGMGVVYKAEDTKLARTVALKFLGAQLLGNAEAKQRFLREAQAAAALHHPNICTVHEIDEAEGRTFIAMALVEGESLEQRIARGPLPIQEALDVAQQIAKGLQAAHNKGIIHRDIKPANLLIARDGPVTIMDFGLARLTEASRLTKADTTMGTVAYMSPEQAQGGALDHRSDIWSLGCVLYEMICGQRPFQGQYDQALFYEIVNEEPVPLTSVRSGVPLELEWIVTKALAKQPDHRYQSANEMAIDLGGVKERSGSARSRTAIRPGVPAQQPGEAELSASGMSPGPGAGIAGGLAGLKRQRTAALAGLALALVALAVVWISRPAAAPPEVLRFSLKVDAMIGSSAVSPDGRLIAYTTGGEQRGLWIQDLRQSEPYRIEAISRPRSIAWSPDGQSLAVEVANALVSLAVSSRTVRTVAALEQPTTGVAWRPDGASIAFTAEKNIYETPALGGSPKLIFSLKEDDVGSLCCPHYLPEQGGNYPLLVTRRGVETEDVRVELIDAAAGRMSTVLRGAAAVYSSSGHILFQDTTRFSEAKLWAVPFSTRSLQTSGEPFAIAEQAYGASLSDRGALVHLEAPVDSSDQIVVRKRGGELVRRVGEPADLLYPRFSPDGQRIAVRGRQRGNSDIWVYDANTGTALRLTDHPLNDSGPVWSPDGRSIVYSSVRDGRRDLFIVPSDGSQQARPWFESAGAKFPLEWSRDGRYLLYQSDGTRLLTLHPDGKIEDGALPTGPVARTGTGASLSPRGDYLAYSSQESGREEIYVRPFPSGDGKWLVSSRGGRSPRWSRGGDEIVYFEGNRLVGVPIQRQPQFRAGEPLPLLEVPVPDGRLYDVSADGELFALIERETKTAIQEIRVIQNWFAEFRDRQQD
jgi:serine/threonine-protein kinase